MTELSMTRGDVKDITLTILNASGGPYNLTGKRVRWHAKRTTGAATVEISKSVGSGITVAAPLTGIAVVRISAIDTTSYADTISLFWDCQVDDNPGDETTVASGMLRITPDITT